VAAGQGGPVLRGRSLTEPGLRGATVARVQPPLLTRERPGQADRAGVAKGSSAHHEFRPREKQIAKEYGVGPGTSWHPLGRIRPFDISTPHTLTSGERRQVVRTRSAS